MLNKDCKTCGNSFKKNPRDSHKQWEGREYCSFSCAARARIPTPPHILFWKNVDKKDDRDCWEWTGSKDSYGYGLIPYAGRAGIKLKAHRVSFEIANGEIPKNKVICHRCDNPSCVNPSHLFCGTQQDNMKDASTKGRLNPKSALNLRPGAKGFHGAGPKSNKELENVIR